MVFDDLGMEVIYEFVVQDMLVMVGVDVCGNLVYVSGLKVW